MHRAYIATTPESVEVFLDVSGRNRYEKFLGMSNESVLLDLREMQGASGFTLVLRRDGYFDKRERLGMDYFDSHDRYPEDGRIRLTPKNWSVPLLDFLDAEWPWIFLACSLLGLLGMAGWRKRVREVERLRKLSALAENAPEDDPLIQTVLGEWRLLSVLGKGGSATVYLAIPDQTLDRSERVAIKVFNEEMRSSEEFLARFSREAKLYQSLCHPGIVQLLDWGQSGKLFYLVLEHSEGESLQGVRVEDEQRALGILKQLAGGLGYAHGKGIVHRDVKPGNVLVTPDGKALLLDFGLAREILSSFTKTGQAMGTPLYMAPEQISGGVVDHRCDQYGLGALAYEMFTGAKTFHTEENEAAPVLFQQIHHDPPPFKEHGVQVSTETEALVFKLMARSPDRRFANMNEVQRALQAALNSLDYSVS